MNVVVAQSGGPTSVINASLLGVYRQALQWEGVQTVYGSRNGIEGILNGNLVPLNEHIRSDEDMARRRCSAPAGTSCRRRNRIRRCMRRSVSSWSATASGRSSISAATILWIRYISYPAISSRWIAPCG